MELHVCITIDDAAVNKIANVITETVKQVAKLQPSGGTNQPAAGEQQAVPQGQPKGAVSTAVPTTPYSAQIAQATQQPVQVMTGQPVPQQTLVPVQQAVPQTSVPVQPAVPQSAVTPQPAQPAAVPTTARNYTMEDLARAAMPLTDQGDQVMAQLKALLASYGVELLQDLPPEQYGNFATALRGMGAQI